MPMDFINQNILLVGIVVVSGLGLLWPLFVRTAGKGVTPLEATLLINREEARVVDVREAAEYAAGHIPEAISLPMSKLAERMHELEKFKAQPLVVCCTSGMRSGKACRELEKQGFSRLHNLSGGIDAWLTAGYPVHKKSGKGK